MSDAHIHTPDHQGLDHQGLDHQGEEFITADRAEQGIIDLDEALAALKARARVEGHVFADEDLDLDDENDERVSTSRWTGYVVPEATMPDPDDPATGPYDHIYARRMWRREADAVSARARRDLGKASRDVELFAHLRQLVWVAGGVLTNREQAAVEALDAQGYSRRTIAEILGLDKSRVSRMLKNPNPPGDLARPVFGPSDPSDPSDHVCSALSGASAGWIDDVLVSLMGTAVVSVPSAVEQVLSSTTSREAFELPAVGGIFTSPDAFSLFPIPVRDPMRFAQDRAGLVVSTCRARIKDAVSSVGDPSLVLDSVRPDVEELMRLIRFVSAHADAMISTSVQTQVVIENADDDADLFAKLPCDRVTYVQRLESAREHVYVETQAALDEVAADIEFFVAIADQIDDAGTLTEAFANDLQALIDGPMVHPFGHEVSQAMKAVAVNHRPKDGLVALTRVVEKVWARVDADDEGGGDEMIVDEFVVGEFGMGDEED